MNKRSLTLLEVIISLALTALLLAVLLAGATRLFTTRTLIEGAKQETQSKSLIHKRINTLFSLLGVHPAEKAKGPLESLDGKVLTFWITRHIDPDPNFCGHIRGEIALLRSSFTMTLIGKNKSVRSEILADDIEEVSWKFFDPFEQPPRLIDTWQDRTGETPPFLHLTITPKKPRSPYTLAFFIPARDNFVVYHPLESTDEVRK